MAETTKPPGQHGSGKPPNTRLVMISAAIGAALVLVVSLVLNWPGSGGGPGVGASGKQGAAPAPPPVFEAEVGSCLNWTEPDAGDIRQVTCAEPHLFEVTGTTELSPELGPDAPFPSTEQWQQIKQQRCTAVATRYLGGDFDPNGRFAVGAFTPSIEGWNDGDRTLHCGLQQPGPSGKLFRITGSVRDLDQSDIHDVGTCLGINGTAVSDPVRCSEPHSVEITGVVDLGEKFPDGYPPVPEQDPFLATRCNELTAKYAGSPTAAEDKKLTVYWDNLTQESWNAGSRKVNCKVSAQLPDDPELPDDGGLAPVTGSVASKVTIGTEPAPSDPATVAPGVPATGTR